MQGFKTKEVKYAFGFCVLELISFTLDIKGGSNHICLVSSFTISLINLLLITLDVYFIKSTKITAENRAEAQQLYTIEIICAFIQLILSGINTFFTQSTANNIPSLFPLALSLTALGFSFRNTETSYLLPLYGILVDTSHISSPVDAEATEDATSPIPNDGDSTSPIPDQYPSDNGNFATEVQLGFTGQTIRRRKNAQIQKV